VRYPPPMQISFLGTGLISWAHSLALKAMRDAGLIDFTLAACFDPDLARAESFASVHGCAVAPNAKEAASRAEAVWVCSPTSSHLELVETAASEGCAVFCEKPLGRNLDEARRIASVVRDAGIPSQVGLVLRTCPVFLELRSIIQSGELGRLMAIQFRDDQFFPVGGHYASKWRAERETAGGGTVIEHSIHDLDILAFAAGPIVSVSAVTSNFAGHEGVEDAAVASLVFSSGGLGTLTSVWHQIAERRSTRRVEAIFERGLVSFDRDFIGPVAVTSDHGEQVRQCEPPEWVSDLPLSQDDIGLAVRMYAQEDRFFVEAVSEGRPPGPSIPEGISAHQAVEAVYRSANSCGAPVDPSTL
jgi:predicted dehydrogenase